MKRTTNGHRLTTQASSINFWTLIKCSRCKAFWLAHNADVYKRIKEIKESKITCDETFARYAAKRLLLGSKKQRRK